MGLSNALATKASQHAHVLVVEVPGRWRLRAEAERLVLASGRHLAGAPADADVLVVCGEPGQRLGEAVELAWQQLPGPRVRVDLEEYDDVAARLEAAYARLLDTAHHRRDAQHRPAAPDLLRQEDEDEHGDMNHGDMDHGDMDHGDMDHGDMDHGDMDHGDMEMAPGGIALAEGGPDRDELEMDVLQIRLGPVLTSWPAGLVLRCSLQGDVITEARAEQLGGSLQPEPQEDPQVRTLDNLTSFLALAGWDDAAAQARRLRDQVLGGDLDAAAGESDRLRNRVRRSRLLRWSLRRLRPVTEGALEERGLPADLAGDTYDRLLRMLERGTVPTDEAGPGETSRRVSPEQVAALVTGLDLAAARLVVASLDIHGPEAEDSDDEEEMSHA